MKHLQRSLKMETLILYELVKVFTVSNKCIHIVYAFSYKLFGIGNNKQVK